MNPTDRPSRSAGTEAEAPTLRGLPESERSLLIVDDDAPLCQRLARAMERRGFVVATAESVAAGVSAATAHPPAFAVVDLRLGDGSGLEVVSALRSARPEARIVVLTGYGNIATAVAAVKAGALDYLPKPADADAVERALLAAAKARRRNRRKTRCRPTGCAGSTSSASSSCATATSRRPPAGSRCTAAPCSASCRSTRRGADPSPLPCRNRPRRYWRRTAAPRPARRARPVTARAAAPPSPPRRPARRRGAARATTRAARRGSPSSGTSTTRSTKRCAIGNISVADLARRQRVGGDAAGRRVDRPARRQRHVQGRRGLRLDPDDAHAGRRTRRRCRRSARRRRPRPGACRYPAHARSISQADRALAEHRLRLVVGVHRAARRCGRRNPRSRRARRHRPSPPTTSSAP